MADSTKLNKDGLNKVWLKVMELIQSLTGNVDRTKGTLQEQIDVKATSEDYGRVKVTNSSAVTDSTGLALAATEKNASIDGTLAKQIDELNGKLTDNYPLKTQISNPNLLDNPWFTVNQRGLTTLSAEGYSVDRWRMAIDIGTINILDNGIEIDATKNSVTFMQQSAVNDVVKKLVSGVVKTITIDMTIEASSESAIGVFSNANAPTARDTTLKSYGRIGSSAVPLNERKTISLTIGDEVRTFDELTRYFPCWLYFPLGWKVIIHAIKLELGSISTLAMDSEPNYALELIKCSMSTADTNDTYANKTITFS